MAATDRYEPFFKEALSMNALRACVYIYIWQLSSFKARLHWRFLQRGFLQRGFRGDFTAISNRPSVNCWRFKSPVVYTDDLKSPWNRSKNRQCKWAFIDLTVPACHIQYTFLNLRQFFSRENEENTKIPQFSYGTKMAATVIRRTKHERACLTWSSKRAS